MKKRLVILLGAGFPLIWNAPSSKELKRIVINILNEHELGTWLIKKIRPYRKDVSFEFFLASLEALLSYSYMDSDSGISADLFRIRSRSSMETEQIWDIYAECINAIIKEIYDYEVFAYQPQNERTNNQLKTFFEYLQGEYSCINIYTLNYDEVLPRILGLSASCCSLNGETFNYDVSFSHKKRMTYLNLHGSIHISNRMCGWFRRVIHNELPQYLNMAHGLQGGNPHERLLFSPIITGYEKSQRILSEHFSFALHSFVNDLSQCNTFLSIGYSFSDPHINTVVRLYTRDRNVNYRFITLHTGSVYNSVFEHSFEDVIRIYDGLQKEKDNDKYYRWASPDMITYKNGFSQFLSRNNDWVEFFC